MLKINHNKCPLPCNKLLYRWLSPGLKTLRKYLHFGFPTPHSAHSGKWLLYKAAQWISGSVALVWTEAILACICIVCNIENVHIDSPHIHDMMSKQCYWISEILWDPFHYIHIATLGIIISMYKFTLDFTKTRNYQVDYYNLHTWLN